jgi:parallel beta-helix repeat protein
MNDVLLKKNSVLALSALLVLSVLVSAQPVKLVLANGIPAPPINHIFIESNGTVEPSTAPIMRNGDVYVLIGDMPNSSIVVKRDNIVIDGSGYGIHGYGTSYYDGIIISYRTNVTIKNMDISPFGYGVRMDYASNNTITGNKMRAFTGVSLLYSDYNQIIGNAIADGYGAQGRGSNNRIIGNNFTSGLSGGGNGMGIYVTGNNNIISQNFMQEELSIQLPSSMYNTISNNTIVNGETGILLGRSSNNLVFGNIVKGKTDARSGALGISSDSYNNTIYANQFENNALAVSLGMQIADFIYNNVSRNRFYHNNFINNTRNIWVALGTPVNYWDNGKEGNYWSDFHGVDSNGDGLSETPYEISGHNTDHHPLMEPIDISAATSPPTIPNPSISPSPSPTPSSSPLPSPYSSPSSSSPSPTLDPTTPPAIPEFLSWMILPTLLTVTVGIVLLLRFNEHKNGAGKKHE